MATAAATYKETAKKYNQPIELIQKYNETKPKTIRRLNVGADNQEKVQYAYSLGGAEFVYLLHSENGAWTFKRKHPTPHIRGGKAFYDFGLCGVSEYYHPEIVRDARMFTDWKWQVQECYKLWKGGTKFYGKDHMANDPEFRAEITSQYIFE